MPFKSFIKEIRGLQNRAGNKLKNSYDRKGVLNRGRSHIAPERSPSPFVSNQLSQWANLPPELLLNIIQRVEISEITWPARRNVVTCAAVCRSWRETTKEVVRTPEECGLFTFPISLMEPGPRESPIQCFIKRERASSTYRLYLGLSPALSGDSSKLLFAAKKIRRATSTEFLISLNSNDFSHSSDACVGKLRSNFLGTKFVINNSQPPYDSAIQPITQSCHKVSLKKTSCRVPGMNCNIATISYELNVLRTRGPRRMRCVMHRIPISAIQEGGITSTPATLEDCADRKYFPLKILRRKRQSLGSIASHESQEITQNVRDPLVLKNKAPRWHEQLQCWCLNFKGRVTVASVKNFQLVAAIDTSQTVPAAEQEKVILQFGKIGKDIFTMDYRYPLSAFHAFAICLSSFDTKPACE